VDSRLCKPSISLNFKPSNHYFLGLSDKLHSIPKEAIHVTPKEFSRPELETEVVIRLNGLGIPQSAAEDFDDVPDLEVDPVPVRDDQNSVDVNVFENDVLSDVKDDVVSDKTSDFQTPKIDVDNFPNLNVSSGFVDSVELPSPLESDVPSLNLNDVVNDADSTSTDGSEKIEEVSKEDETGSDAEAGQSKKETEKPISGQISDDLDNFHSGVNLKKFLLRHRLLIQGILKGEVLLYH
jgi:hypothetical protein